MSDAAFAAPVSALALALAVLAGAVLGAAFFGGLWLTIRRGVTSRHPVLWFGGGLLLRMGITLAGFYLVAGGDWRRLLACVLGFFLARLAATWLIGPSAPQRPPEQVQSSRAP